jgi:hypothetical protein
MKTEEDALDQSIALNHIVMTMLESKRREDFWLRLILIVSILVNLVICIIFVQYEKNMTTTETVTTTVEQDTGEGSGNNVFQSGESAKYVQGNSEEVNYGEADHNSDNNENQNIQPEQGSLSDEVESLG